MRNTWSQSIPLILFIAYLAAGTLSVYNLQALNQKNPAYLDISYSIANFGFVPYGKTIIGKLMHSPDFSTECSIKPQDSYVNYYEENSFLLVPRGQCEFVFKALNAQQLGAQLAIVMDNQKHEKMVVMADNGYGYKVNIPTIFIDYDNGDLLKKLLADNPNSSIMLKITFQNKKTDKVNVMFWLQANNRHSYRLVEDFRKYYPLIQNNIDFSLVYSSMSCDDYCKPDDCYFNQKYCAKNLIHELSATGKQILDQQIRQQIVFKLNPTQWWKYMKYLDEECSVISELKECGAQIMAKNSIDSKAVQQQFKKSFTGEDNSYLFKNHIILQNAGVNKFPSVTLNGVKVKGSLNAQFIFDDICNTLTKPPQSCTKYVQESQKVIQTVTNEWSTLLLVIVIGVIIFSIIFIAYRRYMKRKISFEMQSRVDDMVSKYIEFYSERSGKK